jgi:LmbE family N-acetylglucosaminyl deacetylase
MGQVLQTDFGYPHKSGDGLTFSEDPEQIFSGVVLVIAPHMDDEVLACGGTLAGLSKKDKLYLAYATDGTLSPVPLSSGASSPYPELKEIRMQEAREAMSVLGIPEANIHFLSLPDGALHSQGKRLTLALVDLLSRIKPDQVLIPFRYDRHPDHLALYRAVHLAINQLVSSPEIYEYFVYNRYRLLPGGDIRKAIRPDLLYSLDIQAWSEQKRAALKRYKSQTTLYYDWQVRPILPPTRVEQVSEQPEVFLRYDPDLPGAGVFGRANAWIRLVHFIEPRLKRVKEQLLAMRRRSFPINGS